MTHNDDNAKVFINPTVADRISDGRTTDSTQELAKNLLVCPKRITPIHVLLRFTAHFAAALPVRVPNTIC